MQAKAETGGLPHGHLSAPPPGAPPSREAAGAVEALELSAGGEARGGLELPRPGDSLPGHALHLLGWVDDCATQPVVEARVAGRPARRLPVGPGGSPGRWVFNAYFGLTGLPRVFELLVDVVSDGGRRSTLARLRCRRAALSVRQAPRLSPILVTSLGRTGTTWLMRLLGAHPAIVCHRRYPFETRLAGYFLQLLRVLAQPSDHQASSHPDTFATELGVIGHNPYWDARLGLPGSLEEWLGREYVEALAEFAVGAVDDAYLRLAQAQERREPVYFAEKLLPGEMQDLAWDLYPGAKELFLVRDPRDMLISILEFNAKRGLEAFGRATAESDAAYARGLAGSVAFLLEAWEARRSRGHLVRYEDLVARPSDTLRGVLGYLGLEASAGTLQGMIAAASWEQAVADGHTTTSSPESSVGRWREAPASLREACRALAPVASALGYGVLEDDPRVRP